MSKAEETRQLIIARAASLFNQRGFAGTSISDVMAATNLKKGGIYNHFESKDELALLAFDYAYEGVRQRYRQALHSAAGDPLQQLIGMIEATAWNLDDPPVPGGCPILNTAIDSDDAHPALRERARQAFAEWQQTIARVVEKGKRKGIFRAEVDGAQVASLIIGTMEGALMLSRLYEDATHVRWAQAHLVAYLKSQVLA
jgi:TetR/AcrR family transcriptional regulator, transcriptional repressor for nem operon